MIEYFMQEEVIAGMGLLDEYFEGGSWRERIDPSKLDLFSMTGCILGQIFSHYTKGVHFLGLTSIDKVQDHGFVPSHLHTSYAIPEYSWALLKKTWVAALTGEANDCRSSTSIDGQRMDNQPTQAARVLHAEAS